MFPIISIQIIPPHDKGIQEAILKNLRPWDKSWDTSILSISEHLVDPLQEAVDCYMKALAEDVLEPELNLSCNIEFTYSAMHGVGYPYMAQAFKAANLKVH
jgi:phosphoglucomutase